MPGLFDNTGAFKSNNKSKVETIKKTTSTKTTKGLFDNTGNFHGQKPIETKPIVKTKAIEKKPKPAIKKDFTPNARAIAGRPMNQQTGPTMLDASIEGINKGIDTINKTPVGKGINSVGKVINKTLTRAAKTGVGKFLLKKSTLQDVGEKTNTQGAAILKGFTDSATLGLTSLNDDKQTKDYLTNHKTAYNIGNFAGYTAPFGATSKIFKIGAKNTLGKAIVKSAAEGAAIGGTEAAIKGDDVTKNALNWAAMGAASTGVLKAFDNLLPRSAKDQKVLNEKQKQFPLKVVKTDLKGKLPKKVSSEPITPVMDNNVAMASTEPRINTIASLRLKQLQAERKKLNNSFNTYFKQGKTYEANSARDMIASIDEQIARESNLPNEATSIDPSKNISQFRTNTLERATALSEVDRAKLNPKEFEFIPETSKEWQDGAEKAVNENMQGVMDKIKSKSSLSGGQEAHEGAIIALRLKQQAEQTGNPHDYINWLKTLSSKTRESARALKGTDTAWEKKTADGAIMDTARVVDAVEESVKKTNPNKIKQIDAETKQLKNAVDKVHDESAEQSIKELMPEEMLSNRISNTLKQGTPKEDPIRDMVNELFKSAKESPLPEKVKSVARNPIDYLKQAIQNKGEYTDVWDKAKVILKDKYANNPEASIMLDDYFEKGIIPTYSQSTLNSSVKTGMKQLQHDIVKIVKSSKGNKQKSLEELTNYLTTETGASADQATLLASNIQARFNTLVKEKSDQVLQQMFKTVPKKTQKSVIEKVNELINLGAYDNETIRDLIKQKEGLPILDSNDIKFITEHMDKSRTYPEGSYKQRMEQFKVGLHIANKIPSTGIEKLQAGQRIMMLLNPKSTVVRNPLGNVMLNALETTKNVPASIIDKGLSAIRNTERTTTVRPLTKGIAGLKGAKKGISEWWQDIVNGVDTSPVGGGVELPNKTKIFNEDTGNAVSETVAKGANKIHWVVGKALKLGDTPFYNAAYESRLAELKAIKKTDVITDAMKEEAHLYGLERTLQNDSAMASLFTGIKQANFLNKHPEGKAAFQVVANLILPFAKTPANILDKFIDYSPVGGIKALAHGASRKGKGTFNQKYFVDTMGRSLTGTGLATLGYLMAQNDMITGARDPNKKVEAFETATGKSNYAYKVGDKYYTVDWALPAAAPIMMGADIFKAIKESKDPTAALTNGASSAVNLMFKSTLLQGPSKLMGGYNPAASIANGLLGTTTQVTPTVGKQIAQLVDPITRETYDPNTLISTLNKIKSRIPYVSKSLPAKVDVMGNEIKAYDGQNTPVNVFLNPGFTTAEKKSPGINLINKLYKSTGDEGVIPKLADKTITYKNKKFPLSPEQYTEYQKMLGKTSMKVVELLAKDSSFSTMSEENQAKAIKQLYDKINAIVKLKMLTEIAKGLQK